MRLELLSTTSAELQQTVLLTCACPESHSMEFQTLQTKKKVQSMSIYVERNTINSTDYTRVQRHKIVIRIPDISVG
jgi:hypothetical protein